MSYFIYYVTKYNYFLCVFQLGMLNVNPGKCKDRISVRNESNTFTITADNEGNFKDSMFITKGQTISMTLETCFQLSRENSEKIFEIIVSKSG